MPTLNNSTNASEPPTSTVPLNEECAQGFPPTYTQSFPYNPDGTLSSAPWAPAPPQQPSAVPQLRGTPAVEPPHQEQPIQTEPPTLKRKQSNISSIFTSTSGNWSTINFNLNLCQHKHSSADVQPTKIRKMNGVKEKGTILIGNGSKEQPFILEE